MFDLPFNFPELEPGWVWLAGAGPGDPGLMSLLTLHGLRQADVVVYDALVSEEILSAASKNAELVYAGKRGGKPSSKQEDISKRLIGFAQQKKRVLRLKGGDPFIFGRGGEEALALVEAKVPFRVIPGISAGIGGLAYAGIPLTHRTINSVVTFMTGHDAQGVTPTSVNWEAVAKGSPVLVLFMALRHLEEICDRLQQAGRAGSEPVALISRATLPEQMVIETNLAEAGNVVADANFKPPAIVVIGEIVRLRAGLDWLGALAGQPLVSDPLA
jgi:uroporphyrin-III C-methyltransferase